MNAPNADSGYGDGGYNVYLLRAAGTNEVVGLSVVFIESDEEDEKDEDWEEDEEEEDDEEDDE